MVQPEEQLRKRPVKFTVPGTGDYLDLKNSLLFVKTRNLRADGTSIGVDEKVGPVNNFFHSQVNISLNGKQFPTSGGATYAYKAYLQNLLNYGEEAKQSQLQCSLFLKDEAGFMDVMDPSGATSGLYSRTVFCKESLSFDLEGPILEDFLFWLLLIF